MIESVRIQNYRCLRDVILELGPLTVFVGPNASGKTAIADSLTARGGEVITDASLIKWTDYLHHSNTHPTWTIPASSNNSTKNPNILGKNNRRKYTFELPYLRQGWLADEVSEMDSTGANLTNFFDSLVRADQEKFVAEFIRFVPVYSDIKARANGGIKRLQFQDRWVPELWYEADQVSDGTMLAAAFVALGFQPEPPDLAVIEDPDYGLHPYLQRQVVTMLRDLSEGKIGNEPIQIVCTTHSKAFLDFLKPEEVRFLTRRRDTGETEVHKAPLDNPNWQQVYDRFQNSLGNMWMTGALGGVPGG